MNKILQKIDVWNQPLAINLNNFKFKSLSNWNVNISMGCTHGCRFCYVPDVSAIKQAESLKEYGVKDPDEEWGQYSLLRRWDADAFYRSLDTAKGIPKDKLKTDGHRAIMYCTTTDPYQVFNAGDALRSKELNMRAEQMVRNSLEIIRDNSGLNVRILTRGPLARKHFDIFKSFGNRLVFGMSLPTLNDKLCKIYEPKAPGPQKRLETLQMARDAGLNVYVAMAPTYPECDEADLRATLIAIKELKAITIFHEPINIRAENVARIEKHAKELGEKMNTKVFASKESWRRYALGQLLLVQKLAEELGLKDRLHLWPDLALKNESDFLELRKDLWKDAELSKVEEIHRAIQDQAYYDTLYLPWLEGWWSRISEWPGKRPRQWSCPALIAPLELAHKVIKKAARTKDADGERRGNFMRKRNENRTQLGT